MHVAAGPQVVAAGTGGTAVGGSTGAVVIIALLVVALVSIVVFFGRGRAARTSIQQELAADVKIGFAYLARQLQDVPDAAGTALVEARERLASAQAVAAAGTTMPVLRAARHTLLEGASAAWEARRSAGLDPGPIPPPPSNAPVTPRMVTVEVAHRSWTAHPSYVPGAVHHFAGGPLNDDHIPGGWYAEPFWEPLLAPADADGPAD